MNEQSVGAPARAALIARSDQDGVATLTLDNPSSRNALSLDMIEAMRAAIADISADAAARVLLIAARGPAFSSGHDLREIAAHRGDADQGREFYERLMASCAALMLAIVDLPKPVIAVVEGVATAAGCQLVAACDLAIAGAGAAFALPGVDIGLFCSTPLVAVGRAIAPKHAMEMALTGEKFSAEEAMRIGLVNRIAPRGQAMHAARRLAVALAARSATTLAIGKRAFYRQAPLGLREAYELASRAMVENLLHPDSGEGIDAFLEKRRPDWGSAKPAR